VSNDPADNDLLTVEQVADKLSVGRTTVYELISSGELPSITIRRCRRVLPSDLNAYIARLRMEAEHA
jgi:excisionase family DNA binding protein